jgi:hypothetical protein
MLRTILTLIAVIVPFTAVLMAQPLGGPPPCWPPPCIPIDGGLSALIVAGALYGAKRVHGSRNASKRPL